jgi:glyoxylate reductase
MKKLKVFLTTPVFREIADHPKVLQVNKEKIIKLYEQLKSICDLKVSDVRFPDEKTIKSAIIDWKAQIIGCHLSHPITKDMLEKSNVFAVCTSTMGYNHITMVPGVLITHTPGVLHKTVADFTLALILASLRNLINLHNFVWNEEWKAGQKWDLDENLNTTIDNIVLGLIGMGEIGREIINKIAPWGIKILYYDVVRQENIEKQYPNIKFVPKMEDIFSESDVVSLHIPLLPSTTHIVNENLLKLMKKNALLVNTARGPIIDTEALLKLLERKEICINLALDVYEQEPIAMDQLNRFKKIAADNKDFRFLFIPHNASADANTRAQMAIMILEDLISLVKSKSISDLQSLRLIPEQRYLITGKDKKPDIENYRINKNWS